MVAEATGTPESVGMELRVQFASLMGRLLQRGSGMTQAELSRLADIRQSEISEYMHADANITVDTIGRILHAFGVRGRLTCASADVNGAPSGPDHALTQTTQAGQPMLYEVNIDGEDIIASQTSTDPRFQQVNVGNP